MKFYYHATPAENIASIYKEGLKPGALGCVFMTEDPNTALNFPAFETEAETIVVFKIKVLKADEPNVEETFDHSFKFWKCRCFGYFGTIPPEKIKMVSVWTRNTDDETTEGD